jgi:hypothetical protein
MGGLDMFLRPCAIAIAILFVPSLADAQAWQRYVVPVSGASVDVPTGLFSRDGGAATTGNGRRFVTADGRADLIVQSVANPGGDTPAAFLAKKGPPPGIIYRRVTPRFFVVSSIRKGKIWYNRCNRGPGVMNCVLMNYPASEKRRWDGVVTRISLSLGD